MLYDFGKMKNSLALARWLLCCYIENSMAFFALSGCHNAKHRPTSTMAATQKIAILLRKCHRVDDALRCANLLMAYGAQVSFFCLCRRQRQTLPWQIEPLLGTRLPCFTDNADLAIRYGLMRLRTDELAQKLKKVDWIIPV